MSTYAVRTVNEKKFLITKPNCRKIFTINGKIVKPDGDGIIETTADTKIGVCKVNHWEMHTIRMTVNRRSLHYDAMAERYNLGEPLGVDEEEILLASLEVLETL